MTHAPTTYPLPPATVAYLPPNAPSCPTKWIPAFRTPTFPLHKCLLVLALPHCCEKCEWDNLFNMMYYYWTYPAYCCAPALRLSHPLYPVFSTSPIPSIPPFHPIPSITTLTFSLWPAHIKRDLSQLYSEVYLLVAVVRNAAWMQNASVEEFFIKYELIEYVKQGARQICWV